MVFLEIRTMKKLVPFFVQALILSLFFSCAHIKSGHHIRLKQGETLETVAKNYGLSQNEIQAVNSQRKFRPGEWIFIPLKKGLIPNFFPSNRHPSDYSFSHNFIWPVPSSEKISSYYGTRGNRIHHGIDIPAPPGSYILASEAGKVIYSDKRIRGYGNLTILSHSGGLYTIYAHAEENLTKKGQRISKGQIIAKVGSTGHSTGPHLHFEIRDRYNSLDPMSFIEVTF